MTDSIHKVVERYSKLAVLIAPLGSGSGGSRWEAAQALREAATLLLELQAVEKAARKYFAGYVQDEAAERECCISDDQHADAQALQAALSAIRSLDKTGSDKTAQSNHSPSTREG